MKHVGLEEWEGIRKEWSSSFEYVLDALKAARSETESKKLEKRFDDAIQLTRAHQRIILALIEVVRDMGKELHSYDS